MDSINLYLLIATSVGILSAISVSCAHPTFNSAVRLCAGIILTLALSRPILGFISSPPASGLELPEDPSSATPEYVEVATAAMEKGIASDIADRFSIPTDELRVECRELDFSEMRCLYILVELECSPLLADFPKIRNHVLENYVTDTNGECEVRWIYE